MKTVQVTGWIALAGAVIAVEACAVSFPDYPEGMKGTGGAATTASASSTSSGTICESQPTDDADLDGWTVAQGDCNDCDASVNPGAVELDNLLDDDCNSMVDDLPQPCDMGLVISSMDPMEAVKAVDLCKVSGGPKDWGVTSAKWVMADGKPPPAAAPAVTNFHLGHGLFGGFGPNVHVQHGFRMLALSSGTARAPSDPGYKSVSGFDKSYTSGAPPGFPKDSPVCPGVVTGALHDATGIEIALKAPSNAQGFSFSLNYFTYEWPEYICSTYNDLFVALLTPPPSGHADGNISFDMKGTPMCVNNDLLEVCGCANSGGPPCMSNGAPFACTLGSSQLLGTGFDQDFMGNTIEHSAATGWLVTSAPVKSGDTITLRWVDYDSGDAVLDSTTLIDHWQWLGTPLSEVGTVANLTPK